tara:strand:+ start:578 stop:763 length:186 start_codon:yes stop_codon:yes gene_type:complete
MTEVATMEEWKAFIRSDGYYTAPEFLAQKFYLKTGKLPPVLWEGSSITHLTPAQRKKGEEE